jgi:hypothetical protein
VRARAGLALAAFAGVAAVAGPAAGAGTTTGTLTLREGEGADARALAYRWAGAPVLNGPAASRRLGLAFRIFNSDTRYIPVSLESATGPIPPAPGCAGFVSRPVGQAMAVGDGRALIQVDVEELDVRRGRGIAQIELARVGADPFTNGSFPAPGLVRVETRGCVDAQTGEPVPGDDGGPFADVRDIPAAATTGSERLLGDFASMSIGDRDIPLRRRGGAWRGALRVAQADAGRYGPATEAAVTVALRGTPVQLNARCRVPAELYPAHRVRSRAVAVRLMRRAGFPRARVARADPGGRRAYGLRTITQPYLPCDFAARVTLGPPTR